MKELRVRVKRIKDEAAEIRSFELVRADGGILPAFTPGSHIDVHIADNLVRQYSLCNRPDKRQSYLIAVKREPASRRLAGNARARLGVLFENVVTGQHVKMAIIGKDVEIVAGTETVYDIEEDKRRWFVTDEGITVIPKGARI